MELGAKEVFTALGLMCAGNACETPAIPSDKTQEIVADCRAKTRGVDHDPLSIGTWGPGEAYRECLRQNGLTKETPAAGAQQTPLEGGPLFDIPPGASVEFLIQ